MNPDTTTGDGVKKDWKITDHSLPPENVELPERTPTVRLHIWLENDDGVLFGAGRMMLLDGVARHGSLKKAAEKLGMSYRAAWGKIKQSEQALGVELLEKRGSDRRGYQLSDAGMQLVASYSEWFEKVERDAVRHAREIFSYETIERFEKSRK